MTVPVAAYAASRPVLLDQTYVEPGRVVSVLAKGAPPCPVHVMEIADARRSPEMIGMLGGKPVLAPKDRAAWLLSVIGALKGRGVAADFSNPAVETPGIINARIILQTAWINSVQVSLDESVVFKVEAKGIDGRTIDRFYRGSSSHMNWASGDGEIKNAINIAFSRALDAMAHDLAGLCGAKQA
ncbi:MAG TPA: hypothetical protein VFW19_03340 [Allosphingosinicella sp.]|nr:hypothetical protein [Allosphingosinicella sp.]